MRRAFFACGVAIGVVVCGLGAVGCAADDEGQGVNAGLGSLEAQPVVRPTRPSGEPSMETEAVAPPVEAQEPVADTPVEPGPCPDFAAFSPMATCCEGTGSCVPTDAISDELQAHVSACDVGGACVPNGVIESIQSDAGYWPRACTSLGGAAGACLSVCIPKVGEFADLLPQDLCGAGERCAPCIDPLTGEDSGACGSGLECVPPAAEVVAPGPADGPSDGHGACPDFSSFGDMAECCEGSGSCVPADVLPPSLESQVSACDDGGACVPKAIIASIEDEGGFWPVSCDSIGGAAGVCLSTCIPKVGEFAALLPQDVCQAGERCAPCIDPLTGEDSGACGDGLDCFPEEPVGAPVSMGEPDEPGGPADEPEAAWSCENMPTTSVVDPETFPSCGTAAHCLPAGLVTEEEQQNLAPCDTGFCVPDLMIASGGFFVPESCTSLGGAEGRCLNTVLPAVADLAGVLPVEGCEPYERCAPCCDPMLGGSSGVCEQGCDVGPAEVCDEQPSYSECCGGMGHCIDPEVVPDDFEGSLAKCKGEDKGLLCVPDAMHSADYAGMPCDGNSLLLGEYDGVCLPTCLDIFLEISFDKGPCPVDHMCVPCEDPLLGNPTGAPGCDL